MRRGASMGPSPLRARAPHLSMHGPLSSPCTISGPVDEHACHLVHTRLSPASRPFRPHYPPSSVDTCPSFMSGFESRATFYLQPSTYPTFPVLPIQPIHFYLPERNRSLPPAALRPPSSVLGAVPSAPLTPLPRVDSVCAEAPMRGGTFRVPARAPSLPSGCSRTIA
jgi:hypothetical protein